LPFLNNLREAALNLQEKEFGVAKPDKLGATPRKDGTTPSVVLMRVECVGLGASSYRMNQVAMLSSNPKEESKDPNVGMNAVNIVFSPYEVQEYEAEILVYGPGDVRVYKLEGTGKSPGTQAALKFVTPARTPVKQFIPIVNQTDKPWSISATFECPPNTKNFTGPNSLNVAAKSTGQYPLEFSPPAFIPNAVSECAGKLTLRNTTIDEKYVYILAGNVDEPLAETHINVKCVVREKASLPCKVPVIALEGEEVRVESDLLYVSGPSSFIMDKGNKPTDITLTVCPKQSGLYSGSITFTSQSGEFAWFTVEVNAEPAPPVQELEINTALREAVGLDIVISNPLDKQITFDVGILGDGLLGDNYVELGPQESRTYELIFSPLNYGVWAGGITFTNRDAGEFWYRLQLSADKPAPIVIEGMECEIGKVMTRTLKMENPIGDPLDLQLSNSNNQNYSIVEDTPYTLPAHGSLTLTVQYTPSTLKGEEKAILLFKNPKVADWEFHVTGHGIPPTVMKELQIFAPLGRSVSDTVVFRNPFAQPVSISVVLEATDPSSTNFSLVNAKPLIQVAGYSKVNIPVKFTAPSLNNAQANMVIESAAQGVRWTFPLKGFVFADTEAEQSFHFVCRARSKLEEKIQIELSGLRPTDGEVPVTFEMKIPEAQERLFARALTVEPAGPLVASASTSLNFNIIFEPLRPLSSTIQFLIHRQGGGVWKYDLELVATEPDIDDTIVISSLLGQPSSVSFSLTNQFTVYTPYTAYFTPDSALEFSVDPKSGLLEPYGSAGTQFIISYTSTAYGRADTGRLVILTEEMQWTYEVRGTLPQYRPPEGAPKVVNRLDPAVDNELHRIHTRPKKNYLKTQSRRPPVQ